MDPKFYKPELGQLCFGNPWSSVACPEYIAAGLEYLAREIERVEWNIGQEGYTAPGSNCGVEYITAEFEMRDYYWGEDQEMAQKPNFKCGDLEIRWYKRLGRGMSMNRPIDANEFFQKLDRCLNCLRAKERFHDPLLYPTGGAMAGGPVTGGPGE